MKYKSVKYQLIAIWGGKTKKFAYRKHFQAGEEIPQDFIEKFPVETARRVKMGAFEEIKEDKKKKEVVK